MVIPYTYVDQFPLPIASEERFGMVKLSRYVQEAIEECDIEVISAGTSTVEYTYTLSRTSFNSYSYQPGIPGNKFRYFQAGLGQIYLGDTLPTSWACDT